MQLPLRSGKSLAQALNARVVGNGQEIVVLAHGFGSTQAHWEAVLPSLLRAQKCVVLLDWPGACTTDPLDFETSSLYSSEAGMYACFAHLLVTLLQQELQIDSCTFVGHSMSAMIGCIAAKQHPELFRRLILVGASPRYLNDRDYYGGFEREDVDQLYEAIEKDFDGWAASFGAAVVGTDTSAAAVADPDVVDAFTGTLSRMRPGVALSMARAIFETDYRSLIEEFIGEDESNNIEVHVLQTRKDFAVPLLVSDYFKCHLGSHGCLEILPTDGHLPQLSAPHLFSSALLRHFSHCEG